MIFNSFIYILFLPLVVSAYYLLPKKVSWIWLLLASICYYISFIPIFIVLIAILVLVNYLLALSLNKSEGGNKNVYLTLIIIGNITVLAFFKYFEFIFPKVTPNIFVVNLFYRIEPISEMVLPIGLSYFIFTLLSYHIEIARKTILPEKHLGYFALYLLFFPKIAQGPIERPQHLIKQFYIRTDFQLSIASEGLNRILWGFFKKLVVADRLAIYVNAIYNNQDHHSGISLAVATIFYSFQIYADFSGYTDIALGSAKLFGINLTDNFKRPYLSTSIQDFWSRWHISFSFWIRDYIFLPLAYFGSSKLSRVNHQALPTEKLVYAFAILITFSICGIWHGVGWTFLCWGLLFGIYLSIANWTKKLSQNVTRRIRVKKKSVAYKVYSIILTFSLVTFAWIFFRADSLNDAISIIRRIFTADGPLFFGNPSTFIFGFLGILIVIAADLKHEYFQDRLLILHNSHRFIRIAAIVVLTLLILLIGVFDGGQFMYFQY